MIQAAIFDMDGLLIDSEPFWREAEIHSFGKRGIHLTEEMCMQTMGLRLDEVIVYWYEKFPQADKNFKELENEIIEGVQKLILEKGKPLDGVYYVLDFFKNKKTKIGLASSSFLRLIEIVLSKLKIKDYFDVVHSAEFEQYGKPNPAVYLTVAKKSGIDPADCVVFEDSYNGLLAAKAAGMKTVAIPDKAAYKESKYDIADIKLNSLLEFNETHLKFLNGLLL